MSDTVFQLLSSALSLVATMAGTALAAIGSKYAERTWRATDARSWLHGVVPAVWLGCSILASLISLAIGRRRRRHHRPGYERCEVDAPIDDETIDEAENSVLRDLIAGLDHRDEVKSAYPRRTRRRLALIGALACGTAWGRRGYSNDAVGLWSCAATVRRAFGAV